MQVQRNYERQSSQVRRITLISTDGTAQKGASSVFRQLYFVPRMLRPHSKGALGRVFSYPKMPVVESSSESAKEKSTQIGIGDSMPKFDRGTARDARSRSIGFVPLSCFAIPT